MSDKINGFLVVLESDISEETFHSIKMAMMLLKGVARVEPCVSTGMEKVEGLRVKAQLREKLFDFMNEHL